MRVLVDTNIFLDVLFDRETLVDESQRVLDWCDARPGDGLIAWHTLTNLYYLGLKTVGRVAAMHQIDGILEVFEVCTVGTTEAKAARAMRLPDFEDALQAAAAASAGADWIVTRNKKDFRGSPVEAILPAEFMAQGAL